MPPLNKIVILYVGLLSGCAHEATSRPEISKVKAIFSQAGEIAKGEWWKSFNDPQLNKLIERANQVNPDLTIALAHLREARAVVAGVNANLLPRVDAQVSFQSQRSSANSGKNFPGMPRRFDILTVGGQASWEIDLWDKNKLQAEAAVADALVAGYTLEQVRITLNAEVARLWFAIQSAQTELKCLTQEFNARFQEMEIIEKSVTAGLLSSDPLSTAQLAAAQAKLDETNAQRRVAGFENALRALVVILPGEALIVSEFDATKKVMAFSGPGIPSDLLLSRPDLIAASSRLDAAMAREGAARADFYPSVILNGQLGWQADPASKIARGSSNFWSLMPSLDIPVFDGQRRESNLEISRARIDGAAAQWHKAVLNAFSEVETALADIKGLKDEVILAELVLKAANQRRDNAQIRLSAGVGTKIELVIAERDLSLARRTHAALVLESCQAQVRLATATGGGAKSSAIIR